MAINAIERARHDIQPGNHLALQALREGREAPRLRKSQGDSVVMIRSARTVALTVLTLVVVATPVLAQTTRRAPAPEQSSDAISTLTAEVRALREELAATSTANLRLQMLVARLQAQEQRIIYLDRQRNEISSRRVQAEEVRSEMAMRLRQYTDDDSYLQQQEAEERGGVEAAIREQRERLAEQERVVEQLRRNETDAATALTQEQTRWKEFNARLEELERSFVR
jgi:hypothetical protein